MTRLSRKADHRSALRVLAVVMLGIVLSCLGLSVSGALFRLWPTMFGDQALVMDGVVLGKLQELQQRRKFVTEPGIAYFATPHEGERVAAQQVMDHSIAALIEDLRRDPKRSTVLARFKESLPAFERFAPEERDRACIYYEEIMRIVGVESSGELLNVWRYGVPYGWFVRQKER
jgi:hypothetical protein